MPQRSTAPTVISQKGIPSSNEQVPHPRISVTTDSLGSTLDEVKQNLVRILGQIQDNSVAATKAGRSDVQLVNATQTISTTGTTVTPTLAKVRHGLGKPFRGWNIVRQYAGAVPWAGVEYASNAGLDPSQYLVIEASCTGQYDIKVW